ncbi:unnamed protein product [Sphacelaria rigidula]
MSKLSACGLSHSISMSTVNVWMGQLGCKNEGHTQSYHTDGHERADVVENGRGYVRKRQILRLGQRCWYSVKGSLTPEEFATFEDMYVTGE